MDASHPTLAAFAARGRALILGCAILFLLFPLVGRAQSSPRSDSLRVVQLGHGPATVIVLHGGPGLTHGYMRPEWDALARDYQVAYYDQRGCGRGTRMGPFGWEQHVADLHGLVLRYKEHGPVVLAGSSWGSWLALLYASKHADEVRAVVLSGIPPWPIHPPARLPDFASRAAAERRILAMQGPESIPPEVRARYEALQAAQQAYGEAITAWQRAVGDSIEGGLKPMRTWDSATSARNLLGMDPALRRRLGEACPDMMRAVYGSLDHGPSLDALAAISAPVLLIRGTRPTLQRDGAPELMRVLRHGELVTLMGAGHDPWFDRPEQFFAHVERFLGLVLAEDGGGRARVAGRR